MAGTSRAAAKSSKKGGKSITGRQAARVHEEDHIDSCMCTSEFVASEATPDDELPAARGGVEILKGRGRR